MGQLEREVSEMLSTLAFLFPALVLEDTLGLEPCRGGPSEGGGNTWSCPGCPHIGIVLPSAEGCSSGPSRFSSRVMILTKLASTLEFLLHCDL